MGRRPSHTHQALAAESFMRTFQQLLEQVSTEVQKYTSVLFLIGGMSLEPYVIEAVKQTFPQCDIHPVEPHWESSMDCRCTHH